MRSQVSSGSRWSFWGSGLLTVLLLVVVAGAGLVGAPAASAAPVGVAPGSAAPTGSVVAWGASSSGQTKVSAAAQSGVTGIAAGYYHAMALKANGSVVTWGDNSYGQTTVPVEVRSGVTAIAAGALFSMALKSDGSVVAWGDNFDGQSNVPAAAQSGVTAIAAGAYHSMALKSDGSVVAWGDNSYGKTNVPLAAQSGVTAIAAGFDYSLALKSDGSVVAWGQITSKQTTVPPAAQSGVTGIAAGFYHAMALKADGSVVTWGDNSYGQSTVPVAAQSKVTAIAAGAYHSMALKSDGSVVAWGENSSKQTSVPVAAQSGVTAIAAAGLNSLALVTPPTFTAAAPPDASYGQGYSYRFASSHAASSFAVSSGSLPAGLSLDSSSGTLSGTPSAAGGSSFTVRATSPSGATVDAPVSLTVAKAPVTIAAKSVAATYGETGLGYGYQVSGLLGGDSLTREPTCGVAASGAPAAGTHTITCSGAAAGSNYDVSYLPGKLSVAKGQVLVVAGNVTRGYGEDLPASYDYDIAGTAWDKGSSTMPTCGPAGHPTDVGTYPILCSGADVGANHDVAYQSGTLTITKAPLTVTPQSQSVVYGTAPAAFTGTTSGLVRGDQLTTEPTCTVDGPHSKVGSYPISCTGADAGGNYDLSYGTGRLAVNSKAGVVTADDRTVAYGQPDPDPDLGYSVSGLVDGEQLDTQATCRVVGDHAVPGRYPITCSGGADDDYDLTYRAGSLTVTRAAALVTTDNAAITYGQPDPGFSPSVSGLVGADKLASAPTCGVAGAHAAAGSYPVTCSGGSDPRYDLTYKPATLTVAKAPVVVSANNATKSFGSADPKLTATVTGLLAADKLTSAPTCTVSGAHAAVGSYPVTCTGAAAGGNYSVTQVAGTLTVTKASTRLTAAPLLSSLFRPTATLTRTDDSTPIAGQTIAFSAGGRTLCSATTNAKGVAQCPNTFVLTLALKATYDGTGSYVTSTDTSSILR